MAFHIGQLRRNRFGSYTTPISYNFKNIQTTAATLGSITVVDKALSITSGSFNPNSSYYLSFNVSRLASYNQNIKVYLKNSSATNNSIQILKTCNVTKGSTSYQEFFELVFTPNNTYTDIVFELQRDNSDYSITNSDGTYGRKMNISIVDCSKITNILTSLESQTLKRIGVQGPPGLIMCINGEEVHIGRSGIYELNVGIDITSLGFVIKPSSQTMDGLDYFVMDYQY